LLDHKWVRIGVVEITVSGTETLTYTQAWNAENRLAVVTNTVTGEVTRFFYNGSLS
jgi:hypothetical protein